MRTHKTYSWPKVLFFVSLIFMAPSVIYSQVQGAIKSKFEQLETQLASTVKDDSNKVKLLIQLYKHSSNSEKGIAYAKQAVEVARKFGNPKWLVTALRHYAISIISKGDFLTVIKLLSEASELCKANNLYELEYATLSDLGTAYCEIGHNQKALEYYSVVKQKVENLTDYTPLAIVTLNIAVIQNNLGQYSKALPSLQKALQNTKKMISRRQVIPNLYIEAAASCSELGNNELALAYFDSAQTHITNLGGNLHAEINLRYRLGNFYLKKLKKPEKAIAVLEKFMQSQGEDAVYQKLETSVTIAKSYIALNNPKKAIEALDSNLIFFKVADVPLDEIRETYSLLSKAKTMLGDWKGASEASNLANEMADSIIIQEDRKHATYSIIAHEIESNEKELIKNNLELSAQKKLLSYILIAAIIIAGVSSIAFYYRVKLMRSRERMSINQEYSERLEKEVVERTKEIERAHLEIQSAKERENMSLAILNQKHLDLLDTISKKLNSWRESGDVMAPKVLNSTLNELKDAQKKAEDWGSFMLHFEKIHPEFNQKILEICPSLNNNELKHCAYMKLGLSRKQVAEMVSSSEDAVKLSRNRIRKKLGLGPEDLLQDFINAL